MKRKHSFRDRNNKRSKTNVPHVVNSIYEIARTQFPQEYMDLYSGSHEITMAFFRWLENNLSTSCNVVHADDTNRTQYSLVFDQTSQQLQYDPSLLQRLLTCISDDTSAFVAVPLTIDFDTSVTNEMTMYNAKFRCVHRNLILFDKSRHIMERFEPNGLLPKKCMVIRQDSAIEDLLDEQLKLFSERCGYTYLSPIDIYRYGFQRMQMRENKKLKRTNINGYCVAWTMFYLHFRLLHQELARNDALDVAIDSIQSYNDVSNPFTYFIENYSAWLVSLTNDREFSNLFDIRVSEKTHR